MIKDIKNQEAFKKFMDFINDIIKYFWTFFATFTAFLYFVIKEPLVHQKISWMLEYLLNLWLSTFVIFYESLILIPSLFLLSRYFKPKIASILFFILSFLIGRTMGSQSGTITGFILKTLGFTEPTFASNFIAIYGAIPMWIIGIYIINKFFNTDRFHFKVV